MRSLPEATSPDAILDHITPHTDLIVPLANGEPTATMDVIDAHGADFEGVRVHQMHALHDRRYLHGVYGDRLRHVSYFLSHITRDRFAEGTIDLVPNNFSEVPDLLMHRCPDPIVLVAGSMPDKHGYISLGTNCDYVSSFIGRARFFVECNLEMPRTFGRNQIHLSQVIGWTVVDRKLVEVPPVVPDEIDHRIGALVAERIPDGSTLQTGIGAIPNAILSMLTDHRDLGIHTELISDGLIDLMEAGVVNGVRKTINRTKVVGTFALGTNRLHEFLADNAAVELWPVRYVNNPRQIAQQPGFVAINATLEVDFLGQCASETIGTRYWSSSGGQADFARGAMWSPGGQGFIVLRSTAKDDSVSRIVPRLSPGSAVTTMKNTVDKVVTEWGVAELRGRSIAERTRALIAIAHPDHRDDLRAAARELGYL